MHVPPENLFKYRNLMRIARTLDSLGGSVSGLSTRSGMMSDDEGKVDANTMWVLSNKYRARAQRLRVAPEPKLSQKERQAMRPPLRRPNE